MLNQDGRAEAMELSWLSALGEMAGLGECFECFEFVLFYKKLMRRDLLGQGVTNGDYGCY